jgi:NifB/MoaA-like Fe-S oxidoreductase
LREDLGGEEIVYLETGAVTLTSVDRHELPTGDLPPATVTVLPEHLALFDPASGRRLGSGRSREGA